MTAIHETAYPHIRSNVTDEELVELYTPAVDLQEEFTNPEKNRGRMERYQPIDSHRTVFEKLADILKPKDKRSYLLTGH